MHLSFDGDSLTIAADGEVVQILPNEDGKYTVFRDGEIMGGLGYGDS